MIQLKTDDRGLFPAVIQDAQSNEVLMVAYMNEESLKKTLETKMTHFYSRSRRKFWLKGESSGHVQVVKEILTDCDRDTLVIRVEQKGGACHLG
ncbi:MAG: phosphoribosyl-AMP cyclohydrolase, partial [Candidatus Omnitrophica bacterium]|nr:phosphoribosyl-AMP cyclohydrolase [Candidatus Omnitrophota bacterium]